MKTDNMKLTFSFSWLDIKFVQYAVELPPGRKCSSYLIDYRRQRGIGISFCNLFGCLRPGIWSKMRVQLVAHLLDKVIILCVY